jgi:sugar/nucleoside kinase (ribokinase family)
LVRDGGVDVMLAGTVFLDVVFTGLPAPPEPGVEVWAEGMGSSPGGIANLAVAAARLGLRTALAAVFGDDGYGQWCWDILARSEGVDLSHSRMRERWHSPVTVSMAYDGDRAMVTHGHIPPLTTTELLAPDPPPARAVIVTLEPDGEDPWWQCYRDQGALVFADTGWDPTGRWDTHLLDRLDGCCCFMPNSVEARALTRTETPEAAARAIAERVPLAVVTRGPAGAVACDSATGEVVSVAAVPAIRGQPIDPTGAGDVFGAALVAASLPDWPLERRLRFAALAASLSVTRFGGALAAPGWGDIADWWECIRERSASGHQTARRLAADYAFLAEVIPGVPGEPVRRAEATIARLSDLHGPLA